MSVISSCSSAEGKLTRPSYHEQADEAHVGFLGVDLIIHCDGKAVEKSVRDFVTARVYRTHCLRPSSRT